MKIKELIRQWRNTCLGQRQRHSHGSALFWGIVLGVLFAILQWLF